MHHIGKNGPNRWFVLGLSAHGLAAALLLANVLSSGTERGQEGPTLEPIREAVDLDTSPAGTVRRNGIGVPLARNELNLEVKSATETLALGLSAPGFEDEDWRAEVEGRALELGREALPTLRALVADETRSPEEHVAASELANQLAR